MILQFNTIHPYTLVYNIILIYYTCLYQCISCKFAEIYCTCIPSDRILSFQEFPGSVALAAAAGSEALLLLDLEQLFKVWNLLAEAGRLTFHLVVFIVY